MLTTKGKHLLLIAAFAAAALLRALIAHTPPLETLAGDVLLVVVLIAPVALVMLIWHDSLRRPAD